MKKKKSENNLEIVIKLGIETLEIPNLDVFLEELRCVSHIHIYLFQKPLELWTCYFLYHDEF